MRNWNRARLLIGIVPLSLLVGYLALSTRNAAGRTRRAFGGQALQVMPTLKPFVAYDREHMFGPEGELGVDSERIVAHRDDGSFVDRFTAKSPAGETEWYISIVDVPARKHSDLEPFTRSISTYYPAYAELVRMVHRQRGCDDNYVQTQLSDGSAPSSRILGLEVRAIKRKIGDAITIESWVAPELDCYALATHQSFASGSRNERWTVKLDIGNPPQSLFQIPAGYTERSPLEVEAAYRARYPGHTFYGDKSAGVLQQRYQQHRR